MNDEYKFNYVPADHPNRCQGINKRGEQCCYEAIPGTIYCPKHTTGLKQKRLKMYKLKKWNSRVQRMKSSDEVYTLTSEIGILRMTLENTLDKCTDDAELLQYTPQISKLVVDIEKMVSSSVRLEDKLNRLISATRLASFMETVISSVKEVAEELDAENKDVILEKFANKLEQAFKDITETIDPDSAED